MFKYRLLFPFLKRKSLFNLPFKINATLYLQQNFLRESKIKLRKLKPLVFHDGEFHGSAPPLIPTSICPLHCTVSSLQYEAGSDCTYCMWSEMENSNTLKTQKGKSAQVNTNLWLRMSQFLFCSLSLLFRSSYFKFCFLYREKVLRRSKIVWWKSEHH